jgi:hypothetical protein
MRVTAAEAHQVQRPVYHISLAWGPSDHVDREQIVAVADRVMRKLGLEAHQALLVAHRDTEHPHLHLMVSRVHAETGRAWRGRHDYRALEEIARPLERKVRIPRGAWAPRTTAGSGAARSKPGTLDCGLARSGAHRREALRELVREIGHRDFAEAASWADLETRLARQVAAW